MKKRLRKKRARNFIRDFERRYKVKLGLSYNNDQWVYDSVMECKDGNGWKYFDETTIKSKEKFTIIFRL